MDEAAYRSARARSVLEGRTVGDLISEAIRSFLKRPGSGAGNRSLKDLPSFDLGESASCLSQFIDDTLYGARTEE